MPETNYLKIGDLSQQTGVSVGSLRYYESLGVLTPAERGQNGYRYYSAAAVQQIHFLKKAQRLGFSLEEIGQILLVRDHGQLPCEFVQGLLAKKITELAKQIEQISTFKAELEAYYQQWQTIVPADKDDQEICPLIESVSLQTSVSSVP